MLSFTTHYQSSDFFIIPTKPLFKQYIPKKNIKSPLFSPQGYYIQQSYPNQPNRPTKSQSHIILPPTKYTIAFKKNPSYVLIKPLKHSIQDKVYLVHSLTDLKYYILEHTKNQSKYRYLEQYLTHILPKRLIPKFIPNTKQADNTQSTILEFYTNSNPKDFFDTCSIGDNILSKTLV